MKEIKTLSFFGDNGISSTSANHIANLAKEYTRKACENLAAIRFFNESIALISSADKEIVVSNGSTTTDNIITSVNMIAEANSLIAFLREAIKEKERRFNEAKTYEDDETLKAIWAKYPDIRPSRKPYPTEDDIKQEWSVGEQEKYLSLEAEAAAIGKLIHQDGFLSNARISLLNKLNNPSRVELNGADTIIHKYTPSISYEEVDDLYDRYQKRFRATQAELNGMKKHIADEISKRTMEIDAEYDAAMREYENARTKRDIEIAQFERDLNAKRIELCKQVQELKIVIPNRLKAIYDYLNS